MQVTERRADNEVLLRKSFIPPALHTANDPVLSSYARELHGKLHQQAQALAGKITQLGRGGVAEIGRFLMLQTVNRYEALFAHLTSHSLLHPERLYAACVQLAGELETFGHARARAVEYPEPAGESFDVFQPGIGRFTQIGTGGRIARNRAQQPLEIQQSGLRGRMVRRRLV